MSDEALAKLAKKQFGVFSREQARAAGLSESAIDRRLQSGSWERVRAAIYRFRGCPTFGHQTLMAAWLAAGEGAVVSHASAGRLWRLDGVDSLKALVELSVPLNCGVKVNGATLHRTAIGAGSSMILEGMRITTLARTLVDLATRLPPTRLELALDAATRRSFEVLPEIEDYLATVKTNGRRGAACLKALVKLRSGRTPTDSPLEVLALQRLRAFGLPSPETQWPVFDGDEVPFARIDLAYPSAMIAIPCDGLRAHGNRRQFDLDADQRARLAGLGWHVIPVTYRTVTREAWLQAVRRRLHPHADPAAVR